MPKRVIDALKFLTLPALVVLLGGCGGSSSGTSAQTPLSVSAKTPSGMTVTLSENTSEVAVGGSVHYTLTLTNTTNQSQTFSLGSGCGENVRTGTFSGGIQLYDPKGELLDPVVCGAEFFSTPMTLTPGQSLTGTYSSSGIYSTPGKYTATAVVEILANNQVRSGATGALAVTAR